MGLPSIIKLTCFTWEMGGTNPGLLGLFPGSKTSGWEWPWLFLGDAVHPRTHNHMCLSEALNPDAVSRASLCGSIPLCCSSVMCFCRFFFFFGLRPELSHFPTSSGSEVLIFKELKNGTASQLPSSPTYIPRTGTGFSFYINGPHFLLSLQGRSVMMMWLYAWWTWLDPAQQSV